MHGRRNQLVLLSGFGPARKITDSGGGCGIFFREHGCTGWLMQRRLIGSATVETYFDKGRLGPAFACSRSVHRRRSLFSPVHDNIWILPIPLWHSASRASIEFIVVTTIELQIPYRHAYMGDKSYGENFKGLMHLYGVIRSRPSQTERRTRQKP